MNGPIEHQRRRIRVTGTVQGVGFRPFVYRTATELELVGHVANDSAGVIIEAEGAPARLDELCRRLVADAPPLAHVTSVQPTVITPNGAETGFVIVESTDTGSPDVPVSVDVAPCEDCLAELTDPTDRRYRYPFINCTNCGPRYTITRRIPYDRPQTTMASFEMCERCRAEYHDPADRRFHAQPNACPDCGPQLTLTAPDGRRLAARDEALVATVRRLRAGDVVAVKGVGGFHLAVDARDPAAVGKLRRRKHRDDKPFALLVADLEAARRLVELDAAAERELASLWRPIVLAPRRADAPVAEQVAPSLPELGVMLPPSPLHHLLVHDMGRPLVLTSGNLSDEPIAHTDADAFERLGRLVDAVLTHDRGIHIRCDDSVIRAGVTRRPQMVRRSRGYAPRPLPLPTPARRRVLAVGAELKNTVAVTRGDEVVVSHHIGDLEHYATYTSFLQAVEHLTHLYGVAPEVVAHDLHPEYLSTKFAEDLDVEHAPVQHHHAHIASCLAEHGRSEPVIGLAFDGLGYGTDGSLWGGEALVCDLDGFQRAGHLRAVPLPGGAAAITQPWRMAVVWTELAAGREAAEELGARLDERWPAILSLARSEDTLATTSVGRLFDAVSALLGIRSAITYEGQAAIELEAAARTVAPDAGPALPVDVVEDPDGVVLDPAPLVAAVLAAQRDGVPTAHIAAGFHAALADGACRLAVRVSERLGHRTVALSGGVFQNKRLSDLLAGRLQAAGFEVLTHRVVPANDGGIAIGQAAIAAREPRR